MQAFCDKCTADDSRDSGEEEERGEGQKAGTVYFIYMTKNGKKKTKRARIPYLLYRDTLNVLLLTGTLFLTPGRISNMSD